MKTRLLTILSMILLAFVLAAGTVAAKTPRPALWRDAFGPAG